MYIFQVELTKLQFLPSMGHTVSKEELLVASELNTIGVLFLIQTIFTIMVVMIIIDKTKVYLSQVQFICTNKVNHPIINLF